MTNKVVPDTGQRITGTRLTSGGQGESVVAGRTVTPVDVYSVLKSCSTHSIELFTVPRSKRILDRFNTHNRRKARTSWKRYSKSMTLSRWGATTDPIVFDEHGILLNGQNRLQAIVDSGIPQYFFVLRNFPRDQFQYQDRGRTRSVADTVFTFGNRKSDKEAASISAIMINWDERGDFARNNSHRAPHETEDYYVDNADEIIEAGNFVKLHGIHKVWEKSVAGALCVILSRIDKDDAREFLIRTTTGANLPERSPLLRMRNRLITEKAKAKRSQIVVTAALAIKAWNLWRKGKQRGILSWRNDGGCREPFPIPV